MTLVIKPCIDITLHTIPLHSQVCEDVVLYRYAVRKTFFIIHRLIFELFLVVIYILYSMSYSVQSIGGEDAVRLALTDSRPLLYSG